MSSKPKVRKGEQTKVPATATAHTLRPEQRLAPPEVSKLAPGEMADDLEQNPLKAEQAPAQTDAPETIPVTLLRTKQSGREVLTLVVRLSNKERLPIYRPAAVEAINTTLSTCRKAGGKYGGIRYREEKNPRDGETYLFGMVDILSITSRHSVLGSV